MSGGKQLELLLTVSSLGREIDVHALVDSGCTGSCIDARFVSHYQIPTKCYPNPLKVFNADGSDNEGGLITDYIELNMMINDHKE